MFCHTCGNELPATLGGGGKAFDGLTAISLLTNTPQNANGSYWIVRNEVSEGPVEIGGMGMEIYNGSPVEVHVAVYAARDSMWTVN